MFSGVARNFKRGSHNFDTFYKSIFFGKTNLKLIEKQESIKGGPGACSLGKFLKIYML